MISQQVIYQNTFNNSNDWLISSPGQGSTNNIQGQWQILTTTPSDVDQYMGAMASTTASDGFAVFNGVQYLLTANVDYQDATLELNNIFDFTNFPVVSFDFEQRYKAFNYDETYVEFSTDLGQTWSSIQLNNSVTANGPSLQELVQLNISSIVGGYANVKIRFRWISLSNDDSFGSGYGWMLDDLTIYSPSNDDIQNISSWMYGQTSYGAEYHRIPVSQLDSNWILGSEVKNNGANDQTNITLNSDFGSFSTTAVLPLLEYDSSIIIESTEQLMFTPGTYQVTFTVSSDQEQLGSANFNDNVISKNYEITNSVYSLDGIGVYPAGSEILSSLGTSSWAGNSPSSSDDFFCATGYSINSTISVNSIEFLIDSNTVPNSEVFVCLYDSLNLFGSNPIAQSSIYTVSSNDILNGFINIPLCALVQPGYYYACVNLNSLGNSYPIAIVDDNTIIQPAYSSVIRLGITYTNGNAFAIRLNTSATNNSYSTDYQTACDSYTWIDGNTYYQSSNNATFTLPNSIGCDSIITLDLQIENSILINDTNYFCGSYLYNGQIFYNENIFTETFTATTGCDSIINIYYLLDNSYSIDYQTACVNYTWIDGINYTSSTNTPTFNLQNSSGCDSLITLNLTIYNNQFNPDFSVNTNSFTTPPFVVEFTNTTPSSSNYDFAWDFSDGTILQSNNSLVFHEYLNNGLYDVTLIAENHSTGCTDTMYKSDFIYCAGGPTCSHSSIINQTGPITACLSDSVFLTCNTDPNFTYQWRLNGTYIAGAVDTIYYPTQTGNYSVLISENGCPEVSPDVSVVISSSPQTPIITSNGNITPCLGGSVTLSVPNTYNSYSWSTGGTSSSEVVNSSGSYFVTVTNSTGCEATSPIYTINASFATPPEVCIVGVNPSTNYNRIVWEKPVSTAIDSFYVYKETNQANVYDRLGGISFSDTAIFDDLNSNPSVQSYRYKLTLVDSCGTESAMGAFHKTIHLTINQGVGTSWNLIWSDYEGFTFSSYNIYRGTSSSNMTLLTTIASNLNSYTDLSAPSGQLYYQIEAVSGYVCDPTKSFSSSRSNIVDNQLMYIGGVKYNNVKVYPNPTNSQINIEVDNYTGQIRTAIYDLTGKYILESTKSIIDLSSLSRGLYILRVQYGDKEEEIRLLKD